MSILATGGLCGALASIHSGVMPRLNTTNQGRQGGLIPVWKYPYGMGSSLGAFSPTKSPN